MVEPGGIYHLTPRGNDGRTIFLKDADREGFLMRLEAVSLKYGWIIFGYCLMDTHVHVLVQVPQGMLSGLPPSRLTLWVESLSWLGPGFRIRLG
jgi:REP element-mobilizing transposase RayT